MSERDLKSVPYHREPEKATTLEGGRRVDGRGLEDLRSCCESSGSPARYKVSIFRVVGVSSGGPLPLAARIPAVLKTRVVSQASGSCYGEFGNTKVMVGVYGPRQPTGRAAGSGEEGILNADVKYASFASRTRCASFSSPEDRVRPAGI